MSSCKEDNIGADNDDVPCGGRLYVTIRKSMTRMVSVNGFTKNIPGPLAPPAIMKTANSHENEQRGHRLCMNGSEHTDFSQTENDSSFIIPHGAEDTKPKDWDNNANDPREK